MARGNRNLKKYPRLSSKRKNRSRIVLKRLYKSNESDPSSTVQVCQTSVSHEDVDKDYMDVLLHAIEREPEDDLSNENISKIEIIKESAHSEYCVSGRRIIDVEQFFKSIVEFKHNPLFSCSAENLKIINEKKLGLNSIFYLQCAICEETSSVSTDNTSKNSLDINKAAVLGTISSGGGFSQLEEVLAFCNIPCMSFPMFAATQDEISPLIRRSAFDLMEAAGKEEAELPKEVGEVDQDGIPHIAVIEDGAWCKRSYQTNYSASSGVGVIIGQKSKKIYLGDTLMEQVDITSNSLLSEKTSENKVQETTTSISIPKTGVSKLENFACNENREICDISIINRNTESASIIVNGKNTVIADTQFAESLANIKEECEPNDYVDDKVFVSRTIVNVNGHKSKDYIKDETICTNDIKFEACSHCNIGYASYCTKCQMLVSILNRNVFNNTENEVIEEVPTDILEIRQSPGGCGIFTLKVIPKNVRFGPFASQNIIKPAWKIKGGKFVVNDDKFKFLNWMRYINPAKSILEHNLFAFQYEGNLYYRSIREIQTGEELLLYFGEEYEDSLKNDVQVNFIPTIEHNIGDVFACTFCCLGFSSELHLVRHKATCPYKLDRCTLNQEITQCLYCKIYLELREYLDYHEKYCCKKYARNSVLPTTPGDQKIVSSKRNRQQHQIYKCSQCKYKTRYKCDLKDHANKHYNVKVYRCQICCRRFSRIDNLKLHVTNVHTDSDDRKTSNLKRHLSRNEKRETFKSSTRIHLKKRFKCFKCDYVTKHKTNLNRHSNTHLTVKRFKCTHCDYVTHSKQYLRKHSDVHKKVKRLKCDQCNYVTNRMHNFKRHCDTHRTVKQFGCFKCNYVTHLKYMFEEHVSNHDTVNNFECSQCDYTTCEKRLLTAHSYIHMEVRQYVCSKCDYVTNNKYHLKAHSNRHESEKRFKCLKCDYSTHNNHSLKEHANKHEPDKRLKCPECDYVTNQERYLRMHRYRHQGVKRFECSKCKFKTNYKWYLRVHVCKPSTKPSTIVLCEPLTVLRE